jgi:hypothetical protein
MKYRLIIIFYVLLLSQITAQVRVLSLVFKPVFGEQSIVNNQQWFLLAHADSLFIQGNKKAYYQEKDSIQIQTLAWYISKVRLLHHQQVVWQEENSFHLLDLAHAESMRWDLQVPKDIVYTQIAFDLGIDSVTNVSGALGGDLDPSKGMYWTWQSGYINFKWEGKSATYSSKNNAFQFHLGGYQYPFLACQQIVLDANNKSSVEVILDLKNVLKQVDFSTTHHIMSPSLEALRLSQLLKESIRIGNP